MTSSRQGAAARFKLLLEETSKLSRDTVASKGRPPAQTLLATWQCARLAASYADYQRLPRYRAALEFFLTDLYGPADFSQRDKDIARVYPVMVKMLSAAAIESLALAIELHVLSMKLDRKLLAVLIGDLGLDVTAGVDALTPELYAEAYRRCDNYTDRVQQIELVVGAGELLEQTVQTKMIYMTVKVARRPAKMAGFGELQSFIERGLLAFRKMKGAARFLEALAEREMFILNSIYAGDDPQLWYGKPTHNIVPANPKA